MLRAHRQPPMIGDGGSTVAGTAEWSSRLVGTLLGVSVTLTSIGLSAAPALAKPAKATKQANATKQVSAIQGRSLSDPDGLTNGGLDKPGGSGGSGNDRDGNNG